MYHSSQFFEVFSLLTSMIDVGNGIFTFHLVIIRKNGLIILIEFSVYLKIQRFSEK